jgi:hypothetical protein
MGPVENPAASDLRKTTAVDSTCHPDTISDQSHKNLIIIEILLTCTPVESGIVISHFLGLEMGLATSAQSFEICVLIAFRSSRLIPKKPYGVSDPHTAFFSYGIARSDDSYYSC